MRISDWSSDVCSSDLLPVVATGRPEGKPRLVDIGRDTEGQRFAGGLKRLALVVVADEPPSPTASRDASEAPAALPDPAALSKQPPGSEQSHPADHRPRRRAARGGRLRLGPIAALPPSAVLP